MIILLIWGWGPDFGTTCLYVTWMLPSLLPSGTFRGGLFFYCFCSHCTAYDRGKQSQLLVLRPKLKFDDKSVTISHSTIKVTLLYIM